MTTYAGQTQSQVLQLFLRKLGRVFGTLFLALFPFEIGSNARFFVKDGGVYGQREEDDAAQKTR